MTDHLSSDQISEWIIGERTPETGRHISACAACREQITETEDTLAGFRQSARDWSADELTALAQDAVIRRPRWFPIGAKAVLGTACATLAAIILFVHRPAVEAPSSQISDAALMKQVDAALAEDVPDAMRPLNKLVSWQNTAQAESSPGADR